ncbi:hypothetical protein TC41_2614 [Alicyclobacillus acidocaldarius subsp. acidocaldarius Tc-4-1]|uniref:Uncharacterized protein n=1 Tax=Alicyclobacillus acidocaldarius (strain Tc-4-1) TaxID=1048834 RepID=F8II29_ALIAT|nr:hypothetical protein TC41_2614 [Alicyclobacillus acidocaldarius subsp. acidocaldarius Tc-4-1]
MARPANHTILILPENLRGAYAAFPTFWQTFRRRRPADRVAAVELALSGVGLI